MTGWSIKNICGDCSFKLPSSILKDTGELLISEGQIKTYCVLCGNSGVIVNNRSIKGKFLFGRCAGPCLNPKQRLRKL